MGSGSADACAGTVGTAADAGADGSSALRDRDACEGTLRSGSAGRALSNASATRSAAAGVRTVTPERGDEAEAAEEEAAEAAEEEAGDEAEAETEADSDS
ncbi:hypothetical protein DVH02_14940 [Streptomyces corynorhini]|uniref:Uncharacterized protein n=1 Tax=Streptomyces corynorhini TaxID=2282652 RepID=A0A370BCC8_9ACTN|nr:hypothetical protein DVH02_14940 [Streptomyces corynorhini]